MSIETTKIVASKHNFVYPLANPFCLIILSRGVLLSHILSKAICKLKKTSKIQEQFRGNSYLLENQLLNKTARQQNCNCALHIKQILK
jgi:hypothetical protein